MVVSRDKVSFFLSRCGPAPRVVILIDMWIAKGGVDRRLRASHRSDRSHLGALSTHHPTSIHRVSLREHGDSQPVIGALREGSAWPSGQNRLGGVLPIILRPAGRSANVPACSSAAALLTVLGVTYNA